MKNNEKKQPKAPALIMITCFLLFIFGFGVGEILLKDRTFSEMENRTLNTMPEFSWSNLLCLDSLTKKGSTATQASYTDKLDTYMSDQLPLKDQLVALNVDMNRLLQKDCINGVYFGKDGYYLSNYTEDRDRISMNVKLLSNLADNCPDTDFNFMLVPNSECVLSDKLPGINQSDDQLDTINYVKNNLSDKINLYVPYDDLKKANDSGTQVFYKTDHHWTTDGAKIGFDGLMKSMGEDPLNAQYSVEELKDYYGTHYSKAPSAFAKSDTIKLMTDDNNTVSVNYVNEKKTTDTLFDSRYKTEKEKYTTFLGGNFAQINIDSQGEKDENVLVLKDSYANCVMPFLTSKYKHITMIDMRYYRMQQPNISAFIKQNNIDKVICIFNVEFLNEDTNFGFIY